MDQHVYSRNYHRWKSLKLDNSLSRTVTYVFNINGSAIWTVLQDENGKAILKVQSESLGCTPF